MRRFMVVWLGRFALACARGVVLIGCVGLGSQPALAAGAKRPAGLFGDLLSIFAPAEASAKPAPAAPARTNPLFPYAGSPDAPATQPVAAYRTVCVRLCDGYYWPISDSAPMSRFQQDRSSCETSCEQPAKLYYQPAGASDAAKLVGLDGKSYGALPQAFSYRKSLIPSCRCKAEPWSDSEVERHHQYAATDSVPGAPVLEANAKPAPVTIHQLQSTPISDTDIQAGNPAAAAFDGFRQLEAIPPSGPDAQDPINAIVLPPLTHTHPVRKFKAKPLAALRPAPDTLPPTPVAASSAVQEQPVDGASQVGVHLR